MHASLIVQLSSGNTDPYNFTSLFIILLPTINFFGYTQQKVILKTIKNNYVSDFFTTQLLTSGFHFFF